MLWGLGAGEVFRGDSCQISGNISSLKEWLRIEEAPQGSGKVTIPGSARKPSRPGSLWYGLVAMGVCGQRLDLMTLELSSKLVDSVSLDLLPVRMAEL